MAGGRPDARGAAAGAGASFAYAEQLMMAEQVLQLWHQVPDAARQTGTDQVGVLMLAADAARWAGQPERGLTLAEAALAEAGKAGEPEQRASLLRPRGLLTRRQGGSKRSRAAPLVQVPRTQLRILSPREADRLVEALRTHRGPGDGAGGAAPVRGAGIAVLRRAGR